MFTGSKEIDKSRLNSGKVEDAGTKSPLSDSRSSLLEKYSYSSGKNTERPPSVLDRYNRGSSREKSKEPDGISRYNSSTYPGSGLGRNYGNSTEGRVDKKDRSNEHPPLSYRALRANSARTSREASPDVGVGKANSYRVYSRAPSYARTGSTGSSTSTDYNSTPVSSKFGLTTSSRFSLPTRSNINERVPTAISYSGSDRFRTSSSNGKEYLGPAKAKLEESSKAGIKSEEDLQGEMCRTSKECENESNRLEDLEGACIAMISRGTSPTPPASSSFVRNRRADVGVVVQKERTRCRRKIEKKNQEVQCERTEETSRFSRFGSTSSRVPGAGWTSYLDKFSSSASASGGNPSAVYSGRTFNATASTTGSGPSPNSTRIGGFAFQRANENSTTSRNDQASKVSPTSSQELSNNQHARGQNAEAVAKQDGPVFSRNNNERSLNHVKSETVSRTSPSSNEEHEVISTGKDQVDDCKSVDRVRIAETKDETKVDRLASPKTFHRVDIPNDSRTKRSPDDSQQHSSSRSSSTTGTSRSEEIEEKKTSLPRLNGASPKSEGKLSRTSSKTEYSTAKAIQGVQRERRDSTPKSESSLSSRTTDSSKPFDAHVQDQKRESLPSRKESLSRYLLR
ncbi:hypothetical protein KPH14_011011 [Odynerus spinipes]|uniref:Uncharacterized protein n=1 Tax=Odynerus spinipes TaxID=1348599 RepID=A0AAD9VV25_9HYME|nr:hypothetical protein KPH14_011011 [Odynerus spinipes]